MMTMLQTRRRFLINLALAGAAGLTHKPALLAAEGSLETTTIRLAENSGICIAPQYAAEELLRAEGFTDVRYVFTEPGIPQAEAIGHGDVDFSVNFVAPLIIPLDAGTPITVIAGVHVGCFELFGNETIRSVVDLRGKKVGVQGLGSGPHVFLAAIAAHVGLDPVKDIHWVTPADPSIKPIEMFADGKIDAFLGFPPEPQELRSRQIGHVIVNSSVDRPWSQYFCCMLAGNREFVRKFPVATKRVLRAILKATDLCVTEPARVARLIVDGGFTPSYDYALQTFNDVPYDKWREYDAEDTMRFYGLRLHEIGMIKSNPQKIIAENADWRFLNELKRELKA
jgi:NitT/TauT family transport system substrate-binding protein